MLIVQTLNVAPHIPISKNKKALNLLLQPKIPKPYLEVLAVGLLLGSSIFLLGFTTHKYFLNKNPFLSKLISKVCQNNFPATMIGCAMLRKENAISPHEGEQR
jgi:hypothetical protein